MNRVCLSIQSLDLQFFFFFKCNNIYSTKNKIEQRMVERKTKTTKRKKKKKISAARL